MPSKDRPSPRDGGHVIALHESQHHTDFLWEGFIL